MADIAFLLLIFFLVVTTMGTDSGIQRTLPPLEEKENKGVDVHERNLMLVFVDASGRIMVKGEVILLSQLTGIAREFIQNPFNEESLPEKEMTEIELIGQFPVSKGVISLQTTRGTTYSVYIKVQNELTRAFNELRDEVAMQKFNGRKFFDLDEAQRSAIQKAIPMKISEAEPRNIGGK